MDGRTDGQTDIYIYILYNKNDNDDINKFIKSNNINIIYPYLTNIPLYWIG